jgi:predicted PurR-regulated permease PerM
MSIIKPEWVRALSLLLAVCGLLLILPLHLLACFISGFVVYELVNALTPYAQKITRLHHARWVVVVAISVLVVSCLILAVTGLFSLLMLDVRNPMAFNNLVSRLLSDAQGRLSPLLLHYLPANIDELQRCFLQWLREHIAMLQLVGKNAAHIFVTMLIGMVLGAIISLQNDEYRQQQPPLKHELIERVRMLSQAFRNVVFAQFRISLINTVLSAVFLIGILPLSGVQLPLSKTLIVLTFICGLLPVVGNLISNTLILLVGLSVSLGVGAAALGYLVVIHKIEYFLNARIVGSRIKAKSWEVLLAMLIFEAAFGLSGVIAAPIYYAYLKSEMKLTGLI